MAPVLRKKTSKEVDPVALESDALAKYLNTEEPDSVIDFIEYFGNVQSLNKGRVFAVDSTGIECLYTVHGDPVRQEIRIQFDNRVGSVEEAKEKLKSMAKEAHKLLHHNIDKSYKSPNAKKPLDYTTPKPRHFIMSILMWTTILLAANLADEQVPHSALVEAREFAGGVLVFERILTGLVIMHAILAAVSLGLCLYGRVPLKALLLWIPTVALFGVASLQDCLKVAVRHAMYRDPVTFGVPENVLNGKYMKYRRILTDADLGLTPP